MPRLVASDLTRRDMIHQQWSLEEGVVLPLGHNVASDHLLVSWDDQVAPRHAVVQWAQGKLRVDRASDAPANQPIFYAGREAQSFQLIPGEGFVIGKTVFRVDPREAAGGGSVGTGSVAGSSVLGSSASGALLPKAFMSPEMLNTLTFNPSQEQMDALREVLAKLEAQGDLEPFMARLVQAVKRVIRSARYVAVLSVDLKGKKVVVRSESEATPGICEGLVLDVCRRQEAGGAYWSRRVEKHEYPQVPGMAWAYCAPCIAHKEGQGDLAIYLSGPQTPARAANGDQKHVLPEDQAVFIGIATWILKGVRAIHDLRRSQAWMQAFFPKPIRNLLHQRGPEEVFRTEHANAAVLFCDLRGSCQMAEKGAAELMKSWDRLQAALSVMTEAITNQYGSIGDFAGDAAMGFWGWPPQGSASRDLTEAAKAACKAADILRERFRQKARGQGPLAGFTCGMGIAAGEVVAGMLGTEDQRKIGVFGPVVNLASRLESMTKQLGASILVDQTTGTLLAQADTTLQQCTRYLGNVLPVGMEQPLKVFEVMVSPSDPQRLPPAKLQLFEQGLKEFENGNWAEARKFLARVLEVQDGPSQFLLQYMGDRQSPPDGWDGTIVLTRK